MGLWRREPLHERLAREGGLDAREEAPIDTRPPFPVGIHGVARPRRWDAVVTARVDGPPIDEVHFAALEDGSLVVDEEVPDGSLGGLADALEAELDPPYRAEAIRRDGDVWAVAARRIEVVRVSDQIDGDEVSLTSKDGERTLVVDSEPVFGGLPELERLGRERFGDGFALLASRLDADLWDVRVDPL
jgi:hypothetical protein